MGTSYKKEYCFMGRGGGQSYKLIIIYILPIFVRPCAFCDGPKFAKNVFFFFLMNVGTPYIKTLVNGKKFKNIFVLGVQKVLSEGVNYIF